MDWHLNLHPSFCGPQIAISEKSSNKRLGDLTVSACELEHMKFIWDFSVFVVFFVFFFVFPHFCYQLDDWSDKPNFHIAR